MANTHSSGGTSGKRGKIVKIDTTEAEIHNPKTFDTINQNHLLLNPCLFDSMLQCGRFNLKTEVSTPTWHDSSNIFREKRIFLCTGWVKGLVKFTSSQSVICD